MKTCIGLVILLVASQVNAACQQQAVRKNVRVQQFQQVQQYNAVVVPYQQYNAQPIFWSVGASIAEEYKTTKEDQQAERISNKIMAKLEKRLAAYHASSGGQPVPQQELGLTVLQQNCMKCHNPNSKDVIEKRAPKLFDDQGNLTVSQQEIGSILTVIRKGIMPPKPAELISDDDYLAVKVYLESGKPPVAASNQTQPQPPSPQPPGPSE